MKTKKVKMLYVGRLEKQIISDEELHQLMSSAKGYEAKGKIYKKYWISSKFIESNKDNLNWSLLCAYQPLNKEMIKKYHLYVNFDELVMYQKVSQEVLLRFREQINVDKLVKYQPLSEKFISLYHDVLFMSWSDIVFYQKLSLPFLIENRDKFSVEDLECGSIDEQTVDNFKLFIKMGVV